MDCVVDCTHVSDGGGGVFVRWDVDYVVVGTLSLIEIVECL